MSENKNIQTHAIIIANGQGRVWVVGTDTKRNFTAAGAEHAITKLRDVLPPSWKCWTAELSPISEVLASRRR